MARFELNIYGADDEIIKRYETEHIRYGVLLKALEIAEKVSGMNNADFIKAAQSIVKSVFIGITDDEIEKADVQDVLSTFRQVTNMSSGVNGSKKN